MTVAMQNYAGDLKLNEAESTTKFCVTSNGLFIATAFLDI